MSAAHEFVEFTYAEAIAIAQRNMQENCPSVSRVFLARIAELEAALLAKSAEYDALVARVVAAEVGCFRWVTCTADDGVTGIRVAACYASAELVGKTVRLLVSDDRPSHAAGESRE